MLQQFVVKVYMGIHSLSEWCFMNYDVYIGKHHLCCFHHISGSVWSNM